MLTYHEVKEMAFAAGTIADGYAGNVSDVLFTLDPDSKKVLVVADCGFFHAQYAPFKSVKQAVKAIRADHGVSNFKEV